MKRKRLLLGVILLLLVCSACASSGSEEVEEITIWSFTDEAEYAVEHFLEENPDVKVNFRYIPNSQYQTKLRSALSTGIEAPDVFALEHAYKRKFMDHPSAANLSEAPFNADELIEQQYEFVQEVQKDVSGNVRTIGYQGTPGGIYFRRDLAKEYLGTDDPEEISAMISNWDDIFEIGERVFAESDGQVHALPNWNAISAVQRGNVERPWVENETLIIDEERLKILDWAREAREKNVLAMLDDWSPGLSASMQSGSVLFYAGPTWYLQHVIKNDAPDTSGLWGLAQGPSAFSGGGTYFSVYSESESKELAWEFVKFYGYNHDFLEKLSVEQSYFTSNQLVNEELADEMTDEFLDGQKYFEFFNEEATKVTPVVQTRYDGDIDDLFNQNMNSFIRGNISSKEEFISKFKQDVQNYFPELNVQ
ncbi:ABC transporter substrate-binding protein [Bacillus sp. TS-2]|nr:ABC transporter substrate-binding protein [Bacillus sp. TS-2]